MEYSSQFTKSLESLQNAKAKALGLFQKELDALSGTRPETYDETNDLVKQLQQTRRLLAGAFLHEEQRVILQFSNGSFQLKSTDRKREHLASSRNFPALTVVDASTLEKE